MAMASARKPEHTNPAERFEDEKRRIIDSCFSKREEDGSVSESYITHIRIREDSAYPSSPPPPDSPPDNKKDRVIIVAVRRAGRVRMHKARENNNGTFSIGKTWMLDHLSAIESFTGVQPRSPEEAQRKQWASDTGVVITIQKPYFWMATSYKEKEFFIVSLIKIHRKYAGRDPQLSGFSPQEMASFGSTAQSKPPRQAISEVGRSGLESPGLGSPAGLSLGRPTTDIGPPGRERYVSTSSMGSMRQDTRRQAPPNGYSEYDSARPPDSRNRLNAGRNASPSNRSADSYSGSVAAPHERDRHHGSHSSFESSQTRSSGPLGGAAQHEVPPPLPRGGTPGPLPVPNPRSPDRRAAGYGPPGSDTTSLSGMSQSSVPSSGRFETNLPPERRRPPISNVPGDPGDNSQSFSDEPPVRNDLRTRNESNASHLSKGSASDLPSSRPSTSGRQASPHRPPALNLSPDTRRREERLQSSTGTESRGPGKFSATSGPVTLPDAIPTLPNSAEEKKTIPSRSLDEPRTANEQTKSPKRDAVDTPAKNISDMIKQQLDVNSPTDSTAPSTPVSPEENYRPGLGPMIKKKASAKDVAQKFRKAAAAANAFKPRANGAGERMLKNMDKQGDGADGDGVTGVFVPPKSPLPKLNTDKPWGLDDLKSPETPAVPTVPANAVTANKRNISSEGGQKKETPDQGLSEAAKPGRGTKQSDGKQTEDSKPKQASVDDIRKKQLSNHAAKYAKALGINPILLEGRTTNIEEIFDDVGWLEGKPLKRSFDDLQADIKRELSRVETGSWLDAFEGTDDRVIAVSTMLDRTIAECEELDGLLTLYNVELGTLNDDVQFIEDQSQGLQVQTANQRQLALELQNLLKTISIPSSKLGALQDGNLATPDGLAAVEGALSELYKALITIDPTLPRQEQATLDQRNVDGVLGGGIGNMQAVQDKRSTYIREATDFVLRLRHYLETKYKDAETQVVSTLARNRSSLPPDIKLDLEAWHTGRQLLWIYSPIMLFARNIVPAEWEELISMYGNIVKSTYRSEIKKCIDGWKLITRRPTGQEQEAFFTTPQEKEAESMGRKLTVKRSRTLREAPKVAPGDRSKQEGKIPAYQAFYSALLEICKAVFMEQNFVIKLFHASSTDTTEFADIIANSRPSDRQGDRNLTESGAPEFGGPYGPRVKQQMANIFYTFGTDLPQLVDTIIESNPLHMVGVMYSVEDNREKTQHTNQDFLLEHLNRVHDDLERKYIRFIDEQMSAIDATKVKISKRKGVIGFMKVFPIFAAAVEDMLPSPAADTSEIRGRVNSDYQKIYRAMSKALIEVGSKDQDAGVTGGDEEKEQLNHHILLIENHNHFVEEVDVRNNPVLVQSRDESLRIMSQHMLEYIDSVVRRPLGPLLNAIESAEAAIGAADADGQPPSSIATLASHRSNTFRKNIGIFDAKEIRKGVELLRKRLEKHYGDADNERISNKLVEKVTQECEQRYLNIHERLLKIVRDVYEGQFEVDLRKEDILAAFQR